MNTETGGKNLRAAAALALLSLMITILCACGGANEPHSAADQSGRSPVVLSPTDISLNVGEYLVLDGIFVSGTEGGEWSVSGSDAAAMDAGRLHALAETTAAVVYTAPDGEKASARLTITDRTAELIPALLEEMVSTGAGGDTLGRFEALSEGLSGCPGTAADAKALLEGISLCADGQNGMAALEPLCEPFGISFETARFAAESLCARRQMSDDTVTFSFVGDCALSDRDDLHWDIYFPGVYEKQDSPTYPADKIMHWFKADDMTIINNECAITEWPRHQDKIFLRSNLELSGILKEASVEVATLANNHVYDYFQIGYDDTVNNLNTLGIVPVEYCEPYVTTVKGIEVVIIAAGAKGLFEKVEVTDELVLSLIKEYKKPDNIVIAAMHWGSEYSETPLSCHIPSAHSYIDAGADIVIGHHPHIIQAVELYKGHLIAYSLGNFMYGGLAWTPAPESFILRVTMGRSPDGSPEMRTWSIVPCLISGTRTTANNFQPVTLYGDEANDVVNTLLRRCTYISNGVDRFDYIS